MATPTRQAERFEATRRTLIKTARQLFTTRGYAGTSTEEVIRRAQVSRGALYHHFAGKAELFEAVYEDVEAQLAAAVTRAIAAEPPARRLVAGIAAFLAACQTKAVQRIVLLDGPAALGWERWREIDARHGIGILITAINEAMDTRVLDRLDVEPLAHLLLAALNEAAIAIARDQDPSAARARYSGVIDRLLAGLAPTHVGTSDLQSS